ncbi:MAG: histidine phosphatase family protein [Candidatus Caccosoma sp.]|nr:histidine phosphatase family protein [Candidatus Caccosoma sp.]
MRIIIIRHGEPNYKDNTLTEKGFKEAELLKDRLIKEKIDYVYVSPLNRAKFTADPYLKATNMPYETCDWLQEFPYKIKDYKTHNDRIPWDFDDKYMCEEKSDFYDNSKYLDNPLFNVDSNVHEGYNYVISSFDNLLKKHGYTRNGLYYKAVKPNKDTIVIFAHLGLESVLLSRLFNIPFVAIAQHIAFAPTSVSIIYTEEKEKGIAHFRAQCLGDISHLYVKNEPISFMGRFKETFDEE